MRIWNDRLGAWFGHVAVLAAGERTVVTKTTQLANEFGARTGKESSGHLAALLCSVGRVGKVETVNGGRRPGSPERIHV
jgi:hypothetical protein